MYKRKLKSLASIVICSSFVSNVYAVLPGFYIGLSTGPATNTGGDSNVQTFGKAITRASPRSNQWGTSAFLGYKMNDFVAFEVGADFFSKIRFSTRNNVQTCASPFVRVRDAHAFVKGSFSVLALEAFAKAGVAYVYLMTSGAFNGPSNVPGQPGFDKNLPPNGCGKNNYNSYFKPAFALGLTYDFNQRFVADFAWQRILVGGPPGNIDYYGFGVSYHFVDIYCGQFLC